MNTLFDLTPTLPQGFSYYPDFITETEEKQLLQNIEQFDLQPMKFHEYEAKRKVISFGQGWSFTEKKLQQGNALPLQFQFLIEKIASKLIIPRDRITQFLITEYPVGSVINWHRDAPPFEIIAGVSLLSTCTFKLRPQEKQRQTKANTVSLQVDRRSLYTMQGPAKSEWQHSTAPVNRLRYSLTFRTLKHTNDSSN
ncbi:MAG: alpha-ketoglutarate-dependent dioxygenase AlkB [Chitinophagaceae bacterium]